jgi:hypothetical protein
MVSTEQAGPKKEKRAIARRHLVFYLRVFDGSSARIIGHLADISPRGIMLVSEKKIKTQRVFQLRVKLPKEFSGREELIFSATSRWTRRDSNPDFYITGFEMTGLDREVGAQIKALIKDFSMEQSLQPDKEEPPACSLTHTTGR